MNPISPGILHRSSRRTAKPFCTHPIWNGILHQPFRRTTQSFGTHPMPDGIFHRSSGMNPLSAGIHHGSSGRTTQPCCSDPIWNGILHHSSRQNPILHGMSAGSCDRTSGRFCRRAAGFPPRHGRLGRATDPARRSARLPWQAMPFSRPKPVSGRIEFSSPELLPNSARLGKKVCAGPARSRRGLQRPHHRAAKKGSREDFPFGCPFGIVRITSPGSRR